MALVDEYRLRYSSQIRINVSNPQDSTATTADTDREGYAATDVAGEFLKRGITFDVTDSRHVATGVRGVYAKLLVYTGQADGVSEWSAFMDDLKLLAETTSRDRVIPVTDSLLYKTPDVANAPPDADNKMFDGYKPKAPANTSTNT